MKPECHLPSTMRQGGWTEAIIPYEKMKQIFMVAALAVALAVPSYAQKKKVQAKTTAPTFVHPWQGKRVAYFGDSIIDPNTADSDSAFYVYLKEWLGTTPYVYGISGRQWDDVPNQAERLKKEHGDDFDAIIIFMGTNDFNAGVPIGQWYQETAEQVEAATGELKQKYTRLVRKPVMDVSTYRGRINIALDKLKRMYPTKQIVLLTPLHRGLANFSDRNVQPEEWYQNKWCEYIDAYINGVKEAGEVWAVPVVDWASLSGLFPLFDGHYQYFLNPERDQLHPNKKGHRRLAQTLFYQLLTIPCTF